MIFLAPIQDKFLQIPLTKSHPFCNHFVRLSVGGITTSGGTFLCLFTYIIIFDCRGPSEGASCTIASVVVP